MVRILILPFQILLKVLSKTANKYYCLAAGMFELIVSIQVTMPHLCPTFHILLTAPPGIKNRNYITKLRYFYIFPFGIRLEIRKNRYVKTNIRRNQNALDNFRNFIGFMVDRYGIINNNGWLYPHSFSSSCGYVDHKSTNRQKDNCVTIGNYVFYFKRASYCT